jgi:hypothetical protein
MTLPLNNPLDSLAIPRQFKIVGEIRCPQITANQNDYNPSGFSISSVLNLSSDAVRSITGLQGGVKGRVVIVYNSGAFAITLVASSASSQIQNQFGFQADLQLSPGAGIQLFYDITNRKWRRLDEGFGILAFSAANAAFDKANTANLLAFVGGANAAAAFGQANTATVTAIAAFTVANAASINAGSAFGTANAAAVQAQIGRDTANGGYTTANGAFGQANTAASEAALGRVRANASFSNVYITNVSAGLNFTQNVGSIVAAALTSNVIRWVAGNYNLFSVDPGNNAIKFDVNISPAFDKANTACTSADNADIKAAAAFTVANAASINAASAFGTANSAASEAALGRLRANASFSNVYITNVSAGLNFTQNVGSIVSTALTSNVIRWVAGNYNLFSVDPGNNAIKFDVNISPAFDKANTACTSADNADIKAAAAFTVANAASINAASAFGTANAAAVQAQIGRDTANGGYTNSNGAFTAANTAASEAALGRTRANASFSNITITNTSTGLNFTQNVGNILTTGLTANTLKIVQGFEVIISADAANGAIRLDAAPDLYNSNLWGQIVASSILGGALA